MKTTVDNYIECGMKICCACNDKLSVSRFQKNRRAKDGLKAKCKSCRAGEARISRSNKIQMLKQQQPISPPDSSQATITNRSQYDTKMLTTIVKFAMKQAGCKPAGVTVRLRRSLTQLRGRARRNYWEMHLPSRPLESLVAFPYANRTIAVEERRRAFAIRLYLVAVHESTHVADHQQDKYFGGYNCRWANRPHEKRAIAAEQIAHADLNADQVPKIEAAIEALAKTMTFL